MVGVAKKGRSVGVEWRMGKSGWRKGRWKALVGGSVRRRVRLERRLVCFMVVFCV